MSQNTGQPLQLKPTDIFSLGITLAEFLSGRNKLGFPGSLRGKTYQDLLNAARNLTQLTAQQFRISEQCTAILTSITHPMPFARKTIEQICSYPWVTSQ